MQKVCATFMAQVAIWNGFGKKSARMLEEDLTGKATIFQSNVAEMLQKQRSYASGEGDMMFHHDES